MKANLEATPVFQKNLEQYQKKEYRIVIDEGGTGSSKTYSLAQLFATILMKERDAQITIARKTMPALRATAMKDFFNVLKGMGVYREEWHNKSELIFKYPPTRSEVDFISVDEPTKVRSRRRNYLWLNEANEFTLEDWRQLTMRTSGQIFLDYNPSHRFHWIYDELQTREDCIVIRSTYKDNPFLPEALVKEIESYKNKDKNYWRIYGLGLRGLAETLIYSHWKLCDKLPEEPDDVIYGLDFGFNNQTAFVKIAIKDKKYYWKELLFQSYLTNQDLCRTQEEADVTGKELGQLHQLVKDGKLTYNSYIYADSSEPQRIKEIEDAGFNILPANKSVNDGIDFIKSHEFHITKDSVSVQKEVKSYSWKTKDGKPIDEVVKANDHLMDAGRYACYTHSEGGYSPFPDQGDASKGKGRPATAGLLDKKF